MLLKGFYSFSWVLFIHNSGGFSLLLTLSQRPGVRAAVGVLSPSNSFLLLVVELTQVTLHPQFQKTMVLQFIQAVLVVRVRVRLSCDFYTLIRSRLSTIYYHYCLDLLIYFIHYWYITDPLKYPLAIVSLSTCICSFLTLCDFCHIWQINLLVILLRKQQIE